MKHLFAQVDQLLEPKVTFISLDGGGWQAVLSARGAVPCIASGPNGAVALESALDTFTKLRRGRR